MNAAVIDLKGISKRYILHKQKPFLAGEIVNRWILRKDVREVFWALQDVSFSIQPGESVAFVGHNGAGKSTLLSIIAGTTRPTSGDVTVRGRIGALLELGAGFHPDLTGRENIFLNAALLGLGELEIRQQYEKIVAFSGLEQFIDVALRNYSSGMQMRLGFSVAIHLSPEILIMDEVFAVGDQEFQQKCLQRIWEFKQQGKTLLFVTHNLHSLREICSRAIWLHHGYVHADGPLDEVLLSYRTSPC